jgi:hypothetical protein
VVEQLVDDRFGRAVHVVAGEGGFDIDCLACDLGPLVTSRLGEPGQPARDWLGLEVKVEAVRAERPVEPCDGREYCTPRPPRLLKRGAGRAEEAEGALDRGVISA